MVTGHSLTSSIMSTTSGSATTSRSDLQGTRRDLQGWVALTEAERRCRVLGADFNLLEAVVGLSFKGEQKRFKIDGSRICAMYKNEHGHPRPTDCYFPPRPTSRPQPANLPRPTAHYFPPRPTSRSSRSESDCKYGTQPEEEKDGAETQGWIATIGLRHSQHNLLKHYAYRPSEALSDEAKALVRADVCSYRLNAAGAEVYDARHLRDVTHEKDTFHSGLNEEVMRKIVISQKEVLRADLMKLLEHVREGRPVICVCKSGKHRSPAAAAMLAWLAAKLGHAVAHGVAPLQQLEPKLHHCSDWDWTCWCCFQKPYTLLFFPDEVRELLHGVWDQIKNQEDTAGAILGN